ncbi:MAG: SRPBCC family protein [Ornithinimicrobium sp.]
MQQRTHSETILVQASPHEVYDVVSDIRRTGEWSPTCVRCEWEDPDHTGEGAKFTGYNETAERSWQTTSTVVAAEPGHRWAWEVGDGFVRWAYDIVAVTDGTEVTETWMFLKAGLEHFRGRFGDHAGEEIDVRSERAYRDIPATLKTVRQIVEAP